MQSLKARLASIPEGAAALFFVQVFATLGFAVLYSTLVLYATRHLQFPAREATAMVPTETVYPLRLIRRGDGLGMGSGRVLSTGTRQNSTRVFGVL